MGKFSKIHSYIERRKRKLQGLNKDIKEIMEYARELTIDATTVATPHKEATGTGRLAESWEKDSSKKVKEENGKFSFTIASKVPYAVYVNNGHSLTQHYVPGLFIDESGELIYDKNKKDKLGIVVGTKTKWVKGYRMIEEGTREYKKFINQDFIKELSKRIEKWK